MLEANEVMSETTVDQMPFSASNSRYEIDPSNFTLYNEKFKFNRHTERAE